MRCLRSLEVGKVISFDGFGLNNRLEPSRHKGCLELEVKPTSTSPLLPPAMPCWFNFESNARGLLARGSLLCITGSSQDQRSCTSAELIEDFEMIETLSEVDSASECSLSASSEARFQNACIDFENAANVLQY